MYRHISFNYWILWSHRHAGCISRSKGLYFVGFENTQYFLDLNIVCIGLKKLEEDIFRTDLPKCHFGKAETEWLGNKFFQSGIALLESKTSLNLNLPAPKNLKRLRSRLESVQFLGKIIPNLSQLCHSLQPLLKKNTKFIWNHELETHFQHRKINYQMQAKIHMIIHTWKPVSKATLLEWP